MNYIYIAALLLMGNISMAGYYGIEIEVEETTYPCGREL